VAKVQRDKDFNKDEKIKLCPFVTMSLCHSKEKPLNLCHSEPLNLRKKNNSVAKINNSVSFSFKTIKTNILLKYK
jgi:hypothetical protein